MEILGTFFSRRSSSTGHLSCLSLAPDPHQEGLQGGLVQLLEGGFDVPLELESYFVKIMLSRKHNPVRPRVDVRYSLTPVAQTPIMTSRKLAGYLIEEKHFAN